MSRRGLSYSPCLPSPSFPHSRARPHLCTACRRSSRRVHGHRLHRARGDTIRPSSPPTLAQDARRIKFTTNIITSTTTMIIMIVPVVRVISIAVRSRSKPRMGPRRCPRFGAPAEPASRQPRGASRTARSEKARDNSQQNLYKYKNINPSFYLDTYAHSLITLITLIRNTRCGVGGGVFIGVVGEIGSPGLRGVRANASLRVKQ
jgi:hypothetical protein